MEYFTHQMELHAFTFYLLSHLTTIEPNELVNKLYSIGL